MQNSKTGGNRLKKIYYKITIYAILFYMFVHVNHVYLSLLPNLVVMGIVIGEGIAALFACWFAADEIENWINRGNKVGVT